MQQDPDSRTAADTRRPGTAAAEANSLPNQLSIRRAELNALIARLRAHHHGLRRRGLASSTFVQCHVERPDASFSHRDIRPEQSLTGSSRRVQCREGTAFIRSIPPRRSVLFPRIVLALSGGTSGRAAAARMGRVRVLLERNPPTVPSSRPAPPPFFERAIPLLKIKKRNYMTSKIAPAASQPKNAAPGSKLPVKTVRDWPGIPGARPT